MFNDKILKSVAEAVKAVVDEALKGDQHKIDKNKNGKVDAHDFKLLRKEEAKKPASPFDWKNTPRQTAEKGEKTGHDAKKISTGTVYTKKYTKEEASQEEFNKEIKIAQDKSIGKSKAEVAKPAVQAVKQESVEQLDELSKKTLGKYIKAARDNVRNRSYMIGRDVSKLKPSPQHVRKVKNSTTGIQRAVDRLTKEEVEQIDELSKKTLGSYINKAVSSVANKDYNIGRLHFGDQPEKKADVKQQAREIKKDERVIKKRNRGVDRAVKRLTREEYENLDELEFTVEDVENFMQTEEFEQLDELSKKTLGKYINKAQGRVRYAAHEVGHHLTTLERNRRTPGNFRRLKNSTTGIQRAVDRLTKEEVEQIDELSKKTLGSYINKAVSSVANKDYNIGRLHFGDQPEKKADVKQQAREIKKDERVIKKRNRGVDRAVKRLTREEYENLDELEFTVEDVENFMQTEEFEQLDELKKSTLASYVKKASHDVAHKGALTRQHANDSEAARKDSRYNDARKSMEKADKTFAKSWKRRENMGKAVDRLAKEEVEQIEERSLTTAEKAALEKNVKGMKKNIAGFKERYGKDAKSVMYATATKQAKGE
jgi:hypothetical protein